MTPPATVVRSLYARYVVALGSSSGLLWMTTFVPLLGLYLWTMRTNVLDMSADPVAVTPSAWGLAHQHTPVVPVSMWPTWNPWAVHTGPGLVVSNRAPGLVLLAAPFYLLFGSATPFDPFPASLAAALMTAAAMATLALVARRFLTAPASLAAAFIAGTATTTWAVSGTALWPHGPDQLLLALAMLAMASRSLVWSGLSFAAIAVIRPPHLVIVATIMAFGVIKRRRTLRIICFGAVSLVGLAGYLLYAKVFWHGGIDSGYEAVGSHFSESFFAVSPAALGDFGSNIIGAIFAPGKGILPNSPFLIALLPGLPLAWRNAPEWARPIAVGGTMYLLLLLKANRFSGGLAFWGYRYPLGALTVLAPLLILAWVHWTSQTPLRRGAFYGLVAISVAMQTIGALYFRGPYSNSPWTLRYLVSALEGGHCVPAWSLLVAGFGLAVAFAARGVRLQRASVLDVTSADHVLAASNVDA